MIWGLTPKKVVDRINVVVDELGSYELRIRAYEDQARLSQRLVPGIDWREVAEWRIAHDDFYEILTEARAGVRSGVVHYKEIAKQLPALKRAVGNFKRVLDETDAAAFAGRDAARKALGINAKN